MALNSGQQQFYDAVHRGDRVVMCLGEAGCGKTYSLQQILADYSSSYVVTALSHKACGAINDATGLQARTIHSYLEMVMSNIGYHKQLVPKRDRDGNEKPITPTNLLVIDEISMLTQPLFERIVQCLTDGTVQQLVLLGDLIQLEAIGIQPDFTTLNPTVIQLTEQMRQSSASPQLQSYFANLRTAIENNQFFDPYDPTVPEFTYHQSHKEFCQAYNNCQSDKLVVAYRNTKVDKYNYNIHPSALFEPGDQVIIDKPLGAAANQTIATITEVIEHEPTYYKLLVTNNHGEQFEVFHFLHKPTLEAQLQQFKDKRDYKGYHKALDKCFNFKYSYAATITKTQGSSVEHVFVDLNDITSAYTTPKNKYNNPISLNAQLRYIYVAISRMRSKCDLFIGTTRDYQQLQRK